MGWRRAASGQSRRTSGQSQCLVLWAPPGQGTFQRGAPPSPQWPCTRRGGHTWSVTPAALQGGIAAPPRRRARGPGRVPLRLACVLEPPPVCPSPAPLLFISAVLEACGFSPASRPSPSLVLGEPAVKGIRLSHVSMESRVPAWASRGRDPQARQAKTSWQQEAGMERGDLSPRQASSALPPMEGRCRPRGDPTRGTLWRGALECGGGQT